MKNLKRIILPVAIVVLALCGCSSEKKKLIQENQEVQREIARLDQENRLLQGELEKRSEEVEAFGGFLVRLPCLPRSADVPFLKGGQAPEVLKKVAPDPEWLRWARAQGVVVLEVETDERGDVRRCPCVISGHPLFNQYALRAVIQWKFKPCLINGKPSPVRFAVVVPFNLVPVKATGKGL